MTQGYTENERLGKSIAPEDIEIGMHLTVLHGRKYTTSDNSIGSMLYGQAATVTQHEDRSAKGDILEIKGVCLPYITAIKIGGSCISKEYVYSFDTREWQFMKVNKTYAESLIKDEVEDKP